MMSGFSESVLERKLGELNSSQQSIQQLSLWLIHHRKHYQTVVQTWTRELIKAKENRKLTFLYLGNDVVQNARKKYPEYPKEFSGVLRKVLRHLADEIVLDEKTIGSIGRLIKIWKERNIFDSKVQTELSRIWTTKTLEIAAQGENEPKTPSYETSKEGPPAKKSKRSKSRGSSEVATSGEAVYSENEEDILLSSPPTSVADPPEPEELIKALQELENSASSDAVIREKIARLPPEVSEVSQLANLKDDEEGEKLLEKVTQALTLLGNYNKRLQQELKDRKKVGKMLTDFLSAQKDLESQAEERLEQYKDKLEKVNSVKSELKSHIQSLPDLTKLPDVTGGLAPLPSAGDLFTIK